MINGSLRTKIVTSSVAIFDHTLFLSPSLTEAAAGIISDDSHVTSLPLAFPFLRLSCASKDDFDGNIQDNRWKVKKNHQLKKLFDFLSKSPMFHYLIRLPPCYDCNLQHSLILLSIVFCVWTFFL